MSGKFTHAIVAGFPRCGTTSLFRYLASHPQVRPSYVKETNFFTNNKEILDLRKDDVLTHYQDLFLHSKSGAQVTVEASPSYVYEYKTVLPAISAILPDAKIILLLRDPVSRMISVIEKKSEREPALRGAMLDVLHGDWEGDIEKFVHGEKGVLWQVFLGTYIPVVEACLTNFSQEQLLVLFTEQLASSPRETMSMVCQFLGIPSDFYQDFNFAVENTSFQPRWRQLYRWLLIVNRYFEPFLNRYPGIRRTIRYVHHRINASPVRDSIPDVVRDKLERFYEPSRRQLRKIILETYPHIYTDENLPSWLKCL